MTQAIQPKRRGGTSAETARIREIFARFAARDPHPRSELEYVNPFTLLVAVALSAQATDKGVNKATAGLFAVADTPAAMLALGEERLARACPHHRAVPQQGQERMALSRAAGRAVRRRGPGDARGAAEPARGRAQDRERGAEHLVRLPGHRGGHAYLPGGEPHRDSPPATTSWRSSGGWRTASPRPTARRASLADPARPLHLQGAQARLPRLPHRDLCGFEDKTAPPS